MIQQGDRYLLVEERAGGRLVFNQPAGHVEAGETLIEAVVRETLEETGYAFTPKAVLGIYHWLHEEKNRSYLRIAFCGDARPPTDDPELDEVIVATHWLTREQVLARTHKLRSPTVLRCIDDHRRGLRYPLSCLAELHIERQLRSVGL